MQVIAGFIQGRGGAGKFPPKASLSLQKILATIYIYIYIHMYKNIKYIDQGLLNAKLSLQHGTKRPPVFHLRLEHYTFGNWLNLSRL